MNVQRVKNLAMMVAMERIKRERNGNVVRNLGRKVIVEIIDVADGEC